MKQFYVALCTALFAASLTLGLVAAEEKTLEFEAAELKGAQGQAVIRDAPGDEKEIFVEASGLKPNSVYTLWFVNETPEMDMAGVGKPDYDFRSDAEGNATYRATVLAAELEKWEILEVAYHPDGNVKNMDNIQAALKANLE